MQYFISFLEGVITFISPCLLPMLPIYISYFVGGGVRTTGKPLKGALGFVSCYTLISQKDTKILADLDAQ